MWSADAGRAAAGRDSAELRIGVTMMPPAGERLAFLLRFEGAVQTQHGERSVPIDRADTSDCSFARATHRRPTSARPVAETLHDAFAHDRLVLHPRHDFLADVAALGEGHAVQLVEVRLVRIGVAERIVLAAFGHAERDAMSVVVVRRFGVAQFAGATFVGSSAKRRKPRRG